MFSYTYSNKDLSRKCSALKELKKGFGDDKNFGSEKSDPKQIFGQNILGQQILWVRKDFWTKKFLVQKNQGPKNVGPKNL